MTTSVLPRSDHSSVIVFQTVASVCGQVSVYVNLVTQRPRQRSC
jgi:hypothetical protein